jgi:lipid-A-disaccharide synthase
LIAGKEVVPELVQHDFTAEKVVARLSDILPDGHARSQMLASLATVKGLLQSPNPEKLHPAERAAEAIMALLRKSPVET